MGELVEAIKNWQASAVHGVLEMWQQRAEKWELKSNELELTLAITAQTGAEGLMRKVALKMKNKELAGCVREWRMTQQCEKAEHMAQERGEQIMKRVGMRMLNRDLSDRFMIWSSSWRADAAEQRGLGIMKRAGARMRMGELVEAIKNWQASAVHGVLEMWQQRAEKWELKSNELELTLAITAQAGAEGLMRKVALKMKNKELAGCVREWR